jgi:8-oxo-dGTP pyrophosphatase MutT (NUDIX family)
MITLADVRAALALPSFNAIEAQLKMSPLPPGLNPNLTLAEKPPRQAAVLVLLYPHTPEDWHLLLTRRTDSLRKHSGQISFPGGSRDETDDSFITTALRETCEELGICDPANMVVLGELNSCYIAPTNFEVHPIVATLPALPEMTVSADEVAEVLTFSLRGLLHPATRQHEMRDIMGYSVSVPYYQVGEHKVWGATAVMLSELEARLRAVLSNELQTQIAELTLASE